MKMSHLGVVVRDLDRAMIQLMEFREVPPA